MATTRQTRKQKADAAFAASIADHKRHGELERLIDAMYDRPDYGTMGWGAEKCDLEIELVSLKDKLARES